MEESAPDLDEDFDAHMAAIEAEEAQTAKDWNDWNDGLIAASDEEFNKAPDEKCETCGENYEDCQTCECPNDAKCLKLCEMENGGRCPHIKFLE